MKKHITLKNKKLKSKIDFLLFYSTNFYLLLFLIFTTNQNIFASQVNGEENQKHPSSQLSKIYNNQQIETFKEDLDAIENFLNNIENLTAQFIQTSEKNVVKGKFFLSRSKDKSGKMRIEYLAEPKILIVVNGSILSYKDIELDEVSKLSTNSTPASFLTRPNISFRSKDIEITNIEKDNNQIKISLLKKNRKDAGEFSIIFNTNPLEFLKMEVKNDLGQIISVQLKNIEFPSQIANNLFILKNNEF